MTQATILRPRLYLAGPEVFLPDPIAAGRIKCALAAEAGFEGLYPLDNALDLAGRSKHEQAHIISAANEGLMRSSDGAIANLTPFRGVSMDSGTAFEVGFMRALGRPVFGYSNVSTWYKQRAEAFRRRGIPPGDYDNPSVEIEDFDLAENLMIDVAVRAAQGAVAAIDVAPVGDMTSLDGFKKCLVHARTYFFGAAGRDRTKDTQEIPCLQTTVRTPKR
jgi:nucleoside 2-deoxyribosyltransferase